MITKTEVANNALAYLSAGRITNLQDDDSSKSRAINAVFDQTAKEVIRSHRWACCVRRATLARLAESPVKDGSYGYQYKYQLPADNLRFLDLNGEPWSAKATQFDINGSELHTDEETARIRYVAWISNTEEWDVLLAQAVSVKIAIKVARQITKDGMSGEQLLSLYNQVLAEARHVDAMELGSGENSPLERILDNSPLVNAGDNRYFRRGQLVGLNVNMETETE